MLRNFIVRPEMDNKVKLMRTGFLKNKFIYLFIYLFMAVLGLRCFTWAFSSCGERGLLFIVVRRLLIVVASLVVEQGL